MVGERVGNYRILERIGEGGMGVVYLAEDLVLRRRVALKCLPSILIEHPVARRRLLNEARLASRLNHTNIATIYSIEESGDQVFIAMEYVQSDTLADEMRRGPVPEDRLVRIGEQVAAALDSAHGQEVIHRDVKPSNILVDQAGTVKVVDFGLALRAPTGEASEDSSRGTTDVVRLTEPGQTAGTVAYMSPEQAEGRTPEGASDVFGLGTVLYEASTGRQPFEGPSPIEVAAAVLHEDPVAPRTIRPDLSAGFEKIVLECLDKNPAKRPSPEELGIRLRSLLRARSSMFLELVRERRLRGRWVASLAATLAVAALAATIWLLGRTSDPGDTIGDLEARGIFLQALTAERKATTPSKLSGAEDLYRRALEIESGNPEIRAYLARAAAFRHAEPPGPGVLDEIGEHAAAAAGWPEEAGAAAGWAAWLQGRHEEAAGAASSVLERDPDDFWGSLLLGRARIGLGEVETGISEIRTAAEKPASPPWGRFHLADALADAGRWPEAALEYDGILATAPGDPQVVVRLARTYRMLGRYLEAVPLYRDYLSAHPEDAATAIDFGKALQAVGSGDEAREVLSAVQETAPGEPYSAFHLGELELEAGRPEEARTWYETALSGYADAVLPVDRARRSVVLARLDRRTEAVDGIEASLEDAPDDPEVNLLAAQVHALAGDRSRAFDRISRALELGCHGEEIRRCPAFRTYSEDPEFLDLILAER